jgi:hypothetical protein
VGPEPQRVRAGDQDGFAGLNIYAAFVFAGAIDEESDRSLRPNYESRAIRQ